MAKKWKKVAALSAVAVLSVSSLSALTACNNGDNGKDSTYHTYTSVMPSDWNEFTYLDNNDTQVMNYIGSSFFTFDFKFENDEKFNSDGTINSEGIIPGEFSTQYSAATALKDVTNTVDAKWGYTAEQKAEGGYAWEITLRDDLKWEDGTAIKASDFVYSMEEQLNPLFFHVRASQYYNQIRVKNAKEYLYHTSAKTYKSVASQGYSNIAEAVTHYGASNVYLDVYSFWNAQGYTTEDGVLCPQYVALDDETVYDNPRVWSGELSEDDSDAFTVKWIYSLYGPAGYITAKDLYVQVDNDNTNVGFEDVGLYADGDYKLVLCMDESIQFLEDDGSLSYLAPYMLSSLPLVKKDLYDACKKEPVTGATLWTTNYNTSLETTASWGPYKLETFQGGKSYTLVKNDNWFGYKLDEYKHQYNVDKVACEKMTEQDQIWMSFLSGDLDDISLDVDHKDAYRNSKYTYYSAGSGVFGTNLYANLPILKNNGRNNTILAIDDFRKAISLFLNRDEYNTSLSTSNKTCLGLISLSALYDVNNGLTYSGAKESKEALLRVYGFTELDGGKWTDGTTTYNDYEAAFEAMNGWNPTQAKQLVEKAYNELVSDPDKYGYDSSKKITIKFGTSTDSTGSRRYYNYYVKFFEELTKDTPLEGQIEVVFDASFGSQWAQAFKRGEYELAAGTGFSGSALNPYNFLGCYVNPYEGLMYSTWWDTESEMITFKLPEADGFAQSGQEFTMSVLNWYCCLNGIANSYEQPVTYNWAAAPSNVRLAILAKLEETVLGKYYTIQTTSEYTASILGAQFSYICDADNFFVGFGGIRYMVVNYTDAEWSKFKADHGDLTDFYKAED